MSAAAVSTYRPVWKNPRLAGRIREIDGLRGVAILMVVAFHYFRKVGAPRYPWWDFVAQSLEPWASGVDLFFVLSGFLIAGILLDSILSPSYFRTFYMRRVHRIFPVYFGWLALLYIGLAAGLDQHFHGRVFRGTTPLWLYPVFLQNNAWLWFGGELPPWMAMSWSLAVEEQFYIVLPAIIRFTNRRIVAFLSGAVVLASPLYRWWMVATHPQIMGSWTFSTLAHLDGLAMGVGAALLVRDERCWSFLVRRRGLLRGALALLAVGFLTLSFFPSGWFSIKTDHITDLSALYATALLAVVTNPESLLSKALKTPFLLYFGRISYAVYIFHQGIHRLFFLFAQARPSLMRGPIQALASLALTVLLAEISWRVVESRMIRRGHVRYKY